MIEIFFACSYALFLLYVWYRAWEKNQPKTDHSEPGVVHTIYPKGRRVPKDMLNPNIGGYKPKEQEVGFATGKWSDDDDYKGPITPFIGPIR
jgi:hypothetical protein